MTTKVKVELVQRHIPIVVEVLRSDGTVRNFQELHNVGDAIEEYVHSGQTLRVLEMTTEELHNRYISLGEPGGCPYCGAIAGSCDKYPDCPAGKPNE